MAGTPAVLAPIGPLAGKDGDQFVFTGLQITHVESLDAALVQGLYLALRIEIIADHLVVGFKMYRVSLGIK